MKKTKMQVVTVIVVILLLLIVSTSLGASIQKAQAYSPDYSPTQYSIYYFFDYYPTLGRDVLSNTFGYYSVFYDAQWIDSDEFDSLVTNWYFSGIASNTLASNTIVIIDIKTFKPDADTLELLFLNLKVFQGCQTIFITPYEEYEYGDTTFVSCVDKYFVTYFEEINVMIRQMYDDSYDNSEGALANKMFLLDNRLVNVTGYNQGAPIEILLESSPFLRELFSEYSVGEDMMYENYTEFLTDLHNTYNTYFLVHLGGDEFVDIYDWVLYRGSYLSEMESDSGLSSDVACAVGFWNLDGDFYNFIWRSQIEASADSENNTDLRAYVIDIDPILLGTGPVVTGFSWIANSYSQYLTDRNDLLAYLDDITGGN